MSWMILLTYLIQAVVIIRFPVPSEVSTLQLVKRNPLSVAWLNRSLLVSLGTLGILTFHMPLLFVLIPAIVPWQLLIFEGINTTVNLVLIGICLISGSAISVLGVLSLRRHRPNTPAVVTGHLQTNGVYRFCRHPINLGLMLIMSGFFLTYPLWVMLPGFLAFFYNLHIRARLEESYLTEQYGDNYRAYRQRVSMYGLPTSPK